ncbi:MAG: tRNA (N6-isopentenyl adenosine(37)-C2)-methylthiotransferase MiaB [Candidatus Omnitrophica bacterium]|nr:tRNA (N6-isopentenyl adenosine(37)-C2)-methylthiotransferase MiaB [Candidatus Omnitrophota bacterium]
MQTVTKHNVEQIKVFLRTFGCQMNEYDSELITSILEGESFKFANNEIDANVILLNTCSVRENAIRKIRGHIHEMRHAREHKPAIYGILGCIATNLKEKLLEDKNLDIDLIAGPDNYKQLPELIRQVSRTKQKDSRITFDKNEMYSDIYPKRVEGVNAWIAIMRGCNNFCTFCVVPYTRGRERSRTMEDILGESHKLADEGFKQITLLGQNVNSYGASRTGFTTLLKKISKIEGIQRIRFMSPHPKDFPDELIDEIANNDKVCKHIHLPLQSGSDRILEKMNRSYTQRSFLDLVKKIRTKIPCITLTTDIIVGFPSETEKEFEDTYKVMKDLAFSSAFIFKYSPRKGTVASDKFPDDVSAKTKKDRIVKLNELQRNISLINNRKLIGSTLDVLIEEESTTSSTTNYQGRTDGGILVVFPAGNYFRGQTLKVTIKDATTNVLKGTAA